MTIDCADVQELAPEMALGSLDGAVRAEILAHMAHCPACRAEVRDLADVVDGLAGLAPPVDPPPGLSDRVLDAIRAESPPGPPATLASRRRWRTRHVVAAAVAAAAIGVAATGAVVTATRHEPGNAVTLNARTLAVAAMIGPEAHHLGDAYVSRGEEPWVLVNVAYGLEAASYRLVGVDRNGEVVDIGPMRSLSQGKWAWAGRVDRAPSLTELRIVDTSGGVACRAELS